MSFSKLSNTTNLKGLHIISLIGMLIVLAMFFYNVLSSYTTANTICFSIKKPPVLDKEYTLLADSEIVPRIFPKDTVSVVEFFSYHCHACYEIESAMSLWAENQPNFVHFERVPLGEDTMLSKTIIRLHYFVHQLKKNMTSVLFDWINQKKDIMNPKVVKESLLQAGISEEDYQRMWYSQSGLEAQVKRGEMLEKLYKVEEIPVVIVDGKYKTSPIMTDGNLPRFYEVLDILVEKVKQGKHP